MSSRVGDSAILYQSLNNKQKEMVNHHRRVTWDAIAYEEGVLSEILSRLPVKSIRQFESVNKCWSELIKEKYLIGKQLSRSREKPSYIVCPSMGNPMELYMLNSRSFEYQHITRVDPLARCVEYYMYMIASFNGFVCCINHISTQDKCRFLDLQIWICNPCIKDILLLPRGRPSFEIEPRIGVAYGPDYSEYKVFRIFCVGENNFQCEVYSSSMTGAWRNIGSVPRLPMGVCSSPYRSSHVFASGKIYWLVSTGDGGEILSVDMQEENFQVIKLPEYSKNLPYEDGITEATYLITVGGALSLVIIHVGYMDIWVLKEDCTWELVSVTEIPFEEDEDETVFFMTSSEKEIMFATEEHLWTYAWDTKIWTQEMNPFPTEFVNPVMLPFTESLVPCKGSRS